MTEFIRRCVRCRKDLTDAASRNVGIGPVCRKMDNDVLAKTFDSDPELAIERLSAFDVEALAEPTRKPFAELAQRIRECSKHGDYRAVVAQLEWVLSFEDNHRHAEEMAGIPFALGYAAIPALWAGEIAKSLSTLWVNPERTRLFITGPNKRAGREEIKKVQGRKFHHMGTLHEPNMVAWSVPVSAAEQLRSVVYRYYPMHDFLNGLTWSAVLAMAATAAPADAPKAPVARIFVGADFAHVSTPYDGEFVAQIKALSEHSARWDADTKTWRVPLPFLSKIQALTERTFGGVNVL